MNYDLTMQSTRNLKIALAIICVLIVAGASYVSYKLWRRSVASNNRITTIVTPVPSASPSSLPSVSPTSKSTPTPTLTPTPVPTAIPTTINLDVPFTSQAPEANWDEFHGEACEEASILMAQWYAFGKLGKREGIYANRIPVAEAEKSLVDIVAWERNNVSDWKDTTVEETIRIAKEHLGMRKVTLLDGGTTEDFKKELAKGNIIVLPAAGRLLKNPNFQQPGPPYHMIVLRGYNKDGFISNDPGTRNGEGYVYSEATINNAWHDWTGNLSTIETGLKKAIVVGREP